MTTVNSSVKALAPGEATMKLRVVKKDGTVEEHDGEPVMVSLPTELVLEYKAVVKRLRELEAELLMHAIRE